MSEAAAAYEPSLFIGTPTIDGKFASEYLRGYGETLLGFARLGGTAMNEVRSSFLPRARDVLFDEFRKSGATHWLSADSDIGWRLDDVLQLITTGKDFVSGCYCIKDGSGTINVRLAEGETWASDRLLRASGLAGGFFVMTRAAADRIAERHADRWYDYRGGRYLSLHHPKLDIVDRRYDGEDYSFTERAIAAGVEAWLHPGVRVSHVGSQVFHCMDTQ